LTRQRNSSAACYGQRETWVEGPAVWVQSRLQHVQCSLIW
jgi:hypothetical protein